MSLFTDAEYRHFDQRPSLEEAWRRLPVVLRLEGLDLRWLAPLVDLGHDQWLGELSQGAWGYLEACGWQQLYDEAGALLTARGKIRKPWARSFAAATQRLAAEGAYAGPERCPHRWASWIAFSHSEPRAHLQALAEQAGWGS